MSELTDQQLIEKYSKGEVKSLDLLIKKHLKTVYNFVFCYVKNVAEAEDLTQETFVKVWRNLDKFDQTRSFRNWLLTIAQNTSLDYLKKKKSVPFSQFETENGDNQLIDGLADKTPLVSQVLENRDKIDWLVGSLPELSEKSRQIINLHHDKELTFREIAEQLDEPINTVKSRYRRALIDLKNIFENS